MKKKMGIVLTTVLTIVLGSAIVYSTGGFSRTKLEETVDMATQNICTLPGNVVRMDIKEKDMTTHLERQGQQWINLDHEELEYDWLSLHAWLISFRGVVSEGIIEKVEDKNLYNINDDSSIITLYDEMNNAQTFKISTTTSVNDPIYVSTDEIKGVYKISQDDSHIFEKNINDFVISQKIVPSIDQITTIGIGSKANKNILLTKQNNGDETIWNLENYYDIPYKAEPTHVAKLLEDTLSVNNNSFEGVITSTNDYGILSSSNKLTINDKITINIGNIDKDRLYINIEGDDFVYSIKNTSIGELDKLKAFDLINKEILNITTSNFDEIIFENPQGKYILKSKEKLEIIDKDITEVGAALDTDEDVTKTDTELEIDEDAAKTNTELEIDEDATKTNTELEIDEDATKTNTELEIDEDTIQVDTELEVDKSTTIPSYILYLNDEQIKEEDESELMELINGSIYLDVELKHPEIEKKEERPAESTITCTMKDGKAIKLELVPYDINYYLLRMGDTIEFAINKNKVTTLFSKLNNLNKK